MPDAKIWRLVLKEDHRAWEALVRRYQALVYTVVTRAGLSPDDAGDAFQQTWVNLYQHRSELRDPSRLSAWLVTTAKREALGMRRRTGREVGDEALSARPDTGLLPDEELRKLELQAHLETALAELDTRCRKLTELFFFEPEERSYEEIARALGIATNSLGPIRRRCLERLKQILLKNGYPEVRKQE